MSEIKMPWQFGGVMYQIYPRSFQDSNGDGIGDLVGIAQRLDYLRDGQGGGLGVDGIWLSPFYKSPMADFGYDVSDYCDVDPIFGTLSDFDHLLVEAHRRGLKVIIDFVPNHSSDQHEWFVESRSSKDKPRRDWYIWRDPKSDGSPPNNWLSEFGGSAWTLDKKTGQYYLHSFLPQQPDLNWDNPEVREAMVDALKFWLDRGVDGFRIDAIGHIGKDPSFQDDPLNPDFKRDRDSQYYEFIHKYSREAGNYFDYVNLIADTIEHYPATMTVFETWFMERFTPRPYINFYRNTSRHDALPFNFELIFMPWNAQEFQKFVDDFQSKLKPHDIPVYVLGNHDNPRLIDKIGQKNARVAAMLLLTLPGLSFIYYGEEIGMKNVAIPKDRYQDPIEKTLPGLGRDGERTPMPWSRERYGAFSSSKPWLPLNKDFKTRNVHTQNQDAASILNYYKFLIKFRKSHKVLTQGSYKPGEFIHENVMTFVRELDDLKYLIILNFSDKNISMEKVPENAELVIGTNIRRLDLSDKTIHPHEGLVIDISNSETK